MRRAFVTLEMPTLAPVAEFAGPQPVALIWVFVPMAPAPNPIATKSAITNGITTKVMCIAAAITTTVELSLRNNIVRPQIQTRPALQSAKV